MTTRPLTYRELDQTGCSTPGCTDDHSVIYLHQRCHDRAGVYAYYEKKTRQLVLECRKCSAEVMRIALETSEALPN